MDAVSSNKEFIKNSIHFHPDKKCLQHISYLLCDRKENIYKYCIYLSAIHLGLTDLRTTLFRHIGSLQSKCVCTACLAHVLAHGCLQGCGTIAVPRCWNVNLKGIQLLN